MFASLLPLVCLISAPAEPRVSEVLAKIRAGYASVRTYRDEVRMYGLYYVEGVRIPHRLVATCKISYQAGSLRFDLSSVLDSYMFHYRYSAKGKKHVWEGGDQLKTFDYRYEYDDDYPVPLFVAYCLTGQKLPETDLKQESVLTEQLNGHDVYRLMRQESWRQEYIWVNKRSGFVEKMRLVWSQKHGDDGDEVFEFHPRVMYK